MKILDIQRMDKAMDTLRKRQGSSIPKIIHKFNKLPGEYAGACVNEYPNPDGTVFRVDQGYHVFLDDEEFVINCEDETVKVDKDVLLKLDNYKTLIEYLLKKPVISAITTMVPIEKCERFLVKSPTQLLAPIIISYVTPDAGKILSRIRDKIDNDEVLSDVEALELVMHPKRFTTGNAEVLEEVCHLLKRAKVSDELYKMELILEMKCVIHYFAETLEDIARLEEVIGVSNADYAMKDHDDFIREEARSEGIEEGRFLEAISFKGSLPIERISEISGFSVEELTNEKLNGK